MATRGYSSYRGRGARLKTLIAILLVIIICGAVGYLVAQNYVVYDDSGRAVLSLPHRETTKAPSTDTAIWDEDVTIEYADPVDRLVPVAQLHAAQVAVNALKLDPAVVLSDADEAMIIEVKRINGALTYTTSVDVPQEVFVEQEDTVAHLKTLLASDRYTVAKMSTLCDSYFVRAYHDAAFLLENGGFWYDADSWTWLNPSDERVVSYLTALCQEYAALGFDEILLDQFTYPYNGRTDAIATDQSVDRVAALRSLAETIRATLPEGVALSVVVRSDIRSDLGLSTELLSECFDRIYVAPGVDTSALLAALPDSYDPDTRIVTMDYEKGTASGSYAVVLSETAGVYVAPKQEVAGAAAQIHPVNSIKFP